MAAAVAIAKVVSAIMLGMHKQRRLLRVRPHAAQSEKIPRDPKRDKAEDQAQNQRTTEKAAEKEGEHFNRKSQAESCHQAKKLKQSWFVVCIV